MRRIAIATMLVALSSSSVAAARRHLVFLRSEPADKAVVEKSPTEVRLYFSEKPLLEKTRIAVADSSGRTVLLGQPTLAAKDSAPVVVGIPQPLPSGRYRVTWGSASPDGHAARGSFRFSVK